MSSEAGEPFAARTVAIIVAVATVAFAAFLLLLAFGGDARRSRDGGGHALSVSATGYAGLVATMDGIGHATLLVRELAQARTTGLLIATPPAGSDGRALAALLDQRNGPTLIVLPKWETRPLTSHAAWVEATGTYPPDAVLMPLRKLAPHVRLGDRPTAAPARLILDRIGSKAAQQRLAPDALAPLLTDARGRLVLAQLPGRPIYLLADPDLLDNAGLANVRVMAAATAMIEQLSPNNEIAFDLTLNGLGRTHGTLRLLFEPPFLPATLCLAFAGLLAGLHGAVRFGAPVRPERAVAFGKAALLDNMAMLMRSAGKESALGRAYATSMLGEAANMAGLPPGTPPDRLAAELDRARGADGPLRFDALAATAAAANTRASLLAAARALNFWMRNATP